MRALFLFAAMSAIAAAVAINSKVPNKNPAPSTPTTPSQVTNTTTLPRLEPLKFVNTSRLRIAYYEAGPASGRTILLLHGWPYDIHSYVDVAPALAAKGFRVVVPYMRGHGQTTFLREDTFRSGEQAALGRDAVDLLDALGVKSAVFAGYDWGGRGACVACALWPDRCEAIVSVNDYLIQDLSKAWTPLDINIESGLWFFYYFLTPRGAAALAQKVRDIAEVVWRRNSPQWGFSAAELDRAVEATANPDYVEVVRHSYRHRLLYAPGDPDYADLERELLRQPKIAAPAVTLDGLADGNFPATNGTDGMFTGRRTHHKVPGAGHNLPQEKPGAFVDAVLEAVSFIE